MPLCPEPVLSREGIHGGNAGPFLPLSMGLPARRPVFREGQGAICLFGRKNGKFLTCPFSRSDVE